MRQPLVDSADIQDAQKRHHHHRADDQPHQGSAYDGAGTA
jgi:hypothetical protein